MTAQEDILAVARTVLALEAKLDGVTVNEVLDAAVSAALWRYDRLVRAEIAHTMSKLAEEIENDDGNEYNYDGPAALWLMSKNLLEMIPEEDRPGFS